MYIRVIHFWENRTWQPDWTENPLVQFCISNVEFDKEALLLKWVIGWEFLYNVRKPRKKSDTSLAKFRFHHLIDNTGNSPMKFHQIHWIPCYLEIFFGIPFVLNPPDPLEFSTPIIIVGSISPHMQLRKNLPQRSVRSWISSGVHPVQITQILLSQHTLTIFCKGSPKILEMRPAVTPFFKAEFL